MKYCMVRVLSIDRYVEYSGYGSYYSLWDMYENTRSRRGLHWSHNATFQGWHIDGILPITDIDLSQPIYRPML